MPKAPLPLKRIRLELARSKDFPDGSSVRGYEFLAPLDAHFHIDPVSWQMHREDCRVRWFWDGEQKTAFLVHKPGGAEHAQWAFEYGGAAAHDDDYGYRFGAYAFRPGEYVSIRDDNDEMHTFRVASITPAGANVKVAAL